MNLEPLVSVILPTYNRAPTLARAIRSVLNQSYRNLELLVIDDASTDHTEEVVASIEDSRLRYIRRPQNGGAAAARNTGLAVAHGELVAFQDSDDEWLLGKLERQVATLMAPPAPAALCVSSYLVHHESESGAVRGFFLGASNMTYPNDLRRQVLINFFFGTVAWLARTDIVRAAGGFDEMMRCWEDWELALRISQLGEIRLLDEPLLVQHDSSNSVNKQDRAYGPALRRIVSKHEALLAREPHFLAEHLFLIGRGEMLYGSVAEARLFFTRAIRIRPRFGRAWRGWLFSWFGAGPYAMLRQIAGAFRGKFVPPRVTVLNYVIEIHGSRITARKRNHSDV